MVVKNLDPYRVPKYEKCLNCIETDLKGMKHSKENPVTLVRRSPRCQSEKFSPGKWFLSRLDLAGERKSSACHKKYTAL